LARILVASSQTMFGISTKSVFAFSPSATFVTARFSRGGRRRSTRKSVAFATLCRFGTGDRFVSCVLDSPFFPFLSRGDHSYRHCTSRSASAITLSTTPLLLAFVLGVPNMPWRAGRVNRPRSKKSGTSCGPGVECALGARTVRGKVLKGAQFQRA
jgi:hypothetical protein